jgi:glycosyltransferase involved in cell wall biosynthesis
MQAKRIRIVHLIYNLDVEGGGGGISRFAIELCRSIDPQIFGSNLVSLFMTGTNQEELRIKDLKSEGLNTFALTLWDEKRPYRSFFSAIKVLLQLNKMNRFEIVHSHSEFSDIAAIMVKLLFPRTHLIRTIQYGYSFEWRNRPIRRLLFTNILYPFLFDTEIGVNQDITDRLNKRILAKASSHHALTIHNGVPRSRFYPRTLTNTDLTASLGIPDDSHIIGTVGRLVEQKGYSYFIQAAKLVIEKIPNTYFMIIGDGELKASLVNLAKSLDIESNIFFLGSQPNILEYYSCLCILVSSSLWEGLPNVLLEGMACGIPILGTDIPGTRELIKHGYNGWLVPPADYKSLANGMITLVESPVLRSELVKNSQVTLLDFSIENITRQYEAVYLKCMGINDPLEP